MPNTRWVAGISLVLGPALLLAGVLLRVRFAFFFPDQLAAYDDHPMLMTASYSAFVAGTVALAPGVLALTRLIGTQMAGLAGTLVTLGLFTRTFHAGADHMAFQLVDAQGRITATQAVAASYQGFHIFHYTTFAIMLGWPLLAFAAYRTRTLGPVSSVALALTAALPLGVLKGTTPLSMVATAGLCLAFVPLGLRMLLSAPRPSIPRLAALTAAAVALGYVSSLG
ncbi:hypothetical protein [Spirillospora sp. CA-128828]|uniref:hypothetical protein n=1 Tax=Spirillospora sp. CA-128828 TaxID=3240033 RepID=UPI003D8BB62F